jgi:hypothetical protein
MTMEGTLSSKFNSERNKVNHQDTIPERRLKLTAIPSILNDDNMTGGFVPFNNSMHDTPPILTDVPILPRTN